jgi:hypothetical protein
MGQPNRSGRRPSEVIAFIEHDGVHEGMSTSGRRWRIARVHTGWRLEFRDPDSTGFTYAGTHGSLSAAEREAGD